MMQALKSGGSTRARRATGQPDLCADRLSARRSARRPGPARIRSDTADVLHPGRRDDVPAGGGGACDVRFVCGASAWQRHRVRLRLSRDDGLIARIDMATVPEAAKPFVQRFLNMIRDEPWVFGLPVGGEREFLAEPDSNSARHFDRRRGIGQAILTRTDSSRSAPKRLRPRSPGCSNARTKARTAGPPRPTGAADAAGTDPRAAAAGWPTRWRRRSCS